MSARGLAAHYAALLPGGLNGVELISPERLAIALEKQIPWGQQEYTPRCLGYALAETYSAGGTGFGHGGYGGSNGFADPATGLAVAITKNLFSAQGIHEEVIAILRNASI
jgi:CubicO group peptidase (beta-lactamase class C family)